MADEHSRPGRSLSRRTFLQGGASVLVAATVGSQIRPGTAVAAPPAQQPGASVDALYLPFRTPPKAWRPRGWWHWMSPNDTTDGIVKDLDWFKRVGIAGFHQFTGNGGNSYVESPIVYMTPEFLDAWKLAIQGAAERDLEATLTSSAGWSITGAPFVAAADGMKKHVWTETDVTGGEQVTVTLPQPPTTTGTFLDKTLSGRPSYYKDQAVFAYQVGPEAQSQLTLNPRVYFSGYRATATDTTVTNGDTGVLLSDDDTAKLLNDSIVDPDFLSPVAGSTWVRFEYDRPITLGGVAIAMNGADFGGWQNLIETGSPTVQVQNSVDGVTWSADLAAKDQTNTNIQIGAQRSFAIANSTSAKYWRVVFIGGADPLQVSKLQPRAVPTVHKWEHKAGFGEVGDFYLIDTPAGGLPAVPKSSVTDLTRLMDATGTVTWTPPAGKWVIVRLGYSLTGHQNGPTTPAATGLEVDKLDADRVRAYMNTYLDQFQAAVPADLWGGNGLTGLLCDSIEAGFQTWTDTIINQFMTRRGYDPHPYLPVLVGTVVESALASDKFLWDWRTTLAESLADNHYGTIHEVAHERGLDRFFSEASEDRRGFFGDDTRIRARADIPMGASRSVTAKLGGTVGEQFRLDSKGASSVAHVYGREYAACETFTSTGIQYMPRDMKPFADQLLVAGITQFVFHSTDQQPLDLGPGTSLGPGWYFNRNQTWAEVAAPFVTWMARTSGLLNQGTNIADVAYFYGQEAPLSEQWLPAPAGYGTQPDIPATTQYDFVNDEIILKELRLDKGKLVTDGGASYSLLYLGGMATRFTLDVLKKIRSFVLDGAAVCGLKPSMSPSLADDDNVFQAIAAELWGDGVTTVRKVGRGRVMTGLKPDAALAMINVAPDWTFRPTASPLSLVHRSTDTAEIYFVVNNDHANSVSVDLSLRAVGSNVELWDAVSGNAWLTNFDSRSGRTIVPLTLGAADSIFVIISNGRLTARKLPAITEVVHTLRDSGWTVTFSPPRGTPDSLQLSTLTDLSQSSATDVKYYSGTMVYTTTLTTDIDPLRLGGARVFLDLGSAHEIAQVTLNGKDLGIVWRWPYRVDVTDAIAKGDNVLQVQVTNGWANRIIGDLQPGVTTTYATRYNGQTFGVRIDTPLNPSGLVGPLSLIVEHGRQYRPA